MKEQLFVALFTYKNGGGVLKRWAGLISGALKTILVAAISTKSPWNTN